MSLKTSMDFHEVDSVQITGVKRCFGTREYMTMSITITTPQGNDTEINLYSADTNMHLFIGEKQ